MKKTAMVFLFIAPIILWWAMIKSRGELGNLNKLEFVFLSFMLLVCWMGAYAIHDGNKVTKQS